MRPKFDPWMIYSFANLAAFPNPGEAGFLYRAEDTGFVYLCELDGSVYRPVGGIPAPDGDDIVLAVQKRLRGTSMLDGSVLNVAALNKDSGTAPATGIPYELDEVRVGNLDSHLHLATNNHPVYNEHITYETPSGRRVIPNRVDFNAIHTIHVDGHYDNVIASNGSIVYPFKTWGEAYQNWLDTGSLPGTQINIAAGTSLAAETINVNGMSGVSIVGAAGGALDRQIVTLGQLNIDAQTQGCSIKGFAVNGPANMSPEDGTAVYTNNTHHAPVNIVKNGAAFGVHTFDNCCFADEVTVGGTGNGFIFFNTTLSKAKANGQWPTVVINNPNLHVYFTNCFDLSVKILQAAKVVVMNCTFTVSENNPTYAIDVDDNCAGLIVIESGNCRNSLAGTLHPIHMGVNCQFSVGTLEFDRVPSSLTGTFRTSGVGSAQVRDNDSRAGYTPFIGAGDTYGQRAIPNTAKDHFNGIAAQLHVQQTIKPSDRGLMFDGAVAPDGTENGGWELGLTNASTAGSVIIKDKHGGDFLNFDVAALAAAGIQSVTGITFNDVYWSQNDVATYAPGQIINYKNKGYEVLNVPANADPPDVNTTDYAPMADWGLTLGRQITAYESLFVFSGGLVWFTKQSGFLTQNMIDAAASAAGEIVYESFDVLSNTQKLTAAVYNGKIYIPSSNSAAVDIYDIATNTAHSAPLSQSTNRYSSFAVGGNIWFVNYTGVNPYVKFNPALETDATYAGASGQRFTSQLYNNKIYTPETNGTRMFVFNLATETETTYTIPTSTTRRASALIGNKMYSPRNSYTMDVFDLSGTSATQVTMPYLGNSYHCMVAIGDKIYMPRDSSDSIDILDTQAGTFTTKTLASSGLWRTAAFGADGKIYLPKYDVASMVTFDPVSEMSEEIPLPYAASRAALQRVNNKLYIPQSDGTGMEVIDISTEPQVFTVDGITFVPIKPQMPTTTPNDYLMFVLSDDSVTFTNMSGFILSGTQSIRVQNKEISVIVNPASHLESTAAGVGFETGYSAYPSADKTKLAALPDNAALSAALDTKVDKVPGLQLSQNSYTDGEKSKLGALPGNADLQTQYVQTGAVNQTVGGTKTFSVSPSVPAKTTIGTGATVIATEGQLHQARQWANIQGKPTVNGITTVNGTMTAGTGSGTAPVINNYRVRQTGNIVEVSFLINQMKASTNDYLRVTGVDMPNVAVNFCTVPQLGGDAVAGGPLGMWIGTDGYIQANNDSVGRGLRGSVTYVVNKTADLIVTSPPTAANRFLRSTGANATEWAQLNTFDGQSLNGAGNLLAGRTYAGQAYGRQLILPKDTVEALPGNFYMASCFIGTGGGTLGSALNFHNGNGWNAHGTGSYNSGTLLCYMGYWTVRKTWVSGCGPNDAWYYCSPAFSQWPDSTLAVNINLIRLA